MNQHLTMPRYNIYALVHKGLRAYMGHILNRVGRADWQCDDSCASVLAEVRALADTCLSHLEHENRFLHTAMEARAPGSSRKAGTDHRSHETAIASLHAACDRLEIVPRSSRESYGAALYTGLALFIAENFEHMAMEETVHNDVLWRHYSDAEIEAIERALVASIAPDKSLHFLRWMLSATGPSERAEKLRGIRAEAPAPVFDAILAALLPLLSAAEAQQLQIALALPTTFADCDPAELDAFRWQEEVNLRRTQAVA